MRDRDCIWVATAAWITGLVSLYCDHLQLSRPLIVDMRTLFAVMTCCTISTVLIAKVRSVSDMTHPELYLWTRTVSRWVYILMYFLALPRVCLFLLETYQTCATCGVKHTITVARPLDDFQFYIACCVIPLWLVRAVILTAPFQQRGESRALQTHAAALRTTRLDSVVRP